MKQTGASGLVSAFSGDRFHVEDIRARDRRQERADVGSDYAAEFLSAQQPPSRQGGLTIGRPPPHLVRPGDDMVAEFSRFDTGRAHAPLEHAFELYLHRGVASLDVAERMALPPLPVLMDRAVRFVHSAFPRLSRSQVEAKATEMLHNLDLDECRGRPHDDWASEMRSDQWAEDYMQEQRRTPMQRLYQQQGGEWAEEMRLEDAYSQPTWAREYVQDEFAGLDRAYEAEKWVSEFQEDQKKRVAEEDDGWFDQFLDKEKALQVDSLKQITAKLSAIDDPKLQNSNFMSFVKGYAANNGAHPNDWVSDFRNDPTSAGGSMRQQGGDWETEYGHDEQELLDSVFENAEFEPPNWQRTFTDEYQCAPDNPFAEASDPYQMGVDFFNNGRFADAVLALEAAVSRNPQDGQAWHLLGKAHQEGDKDWQAVAALQNATRCDPSNLLGLVDQAVSYTNNMQKDRALVSLEQWLRNNPRYTRLAPPPLQIGTGDVAYELRQLYERQDVLIDAFVEAAQTSPDNVDPDVQICLGLLYSLAQEYDNAAMCFQAALTKKPDDYALWNKLGATLANSGLSQEALQAYFQALERKPLYVRARANLGISFLAMKLYVDAAKQFLAALSIEPDAVHIWTNLETTFSYMQRRDLVTLARSRNVSAFKKEFDF